MEDEIKTRQFAMNGELKKRSVPQSAPDGNLYTDDHKLSKDASDKSKDSPTDPTVWVVFFSLLIDLLAFTVILPLFPSLLEFYASNKEVSNCFVLVKCLHV